MHPCIVEVTTKRQIRDSLKRNFLSQKKFSPLIEISRPQRDLFVCVGSFFCVGNVPTCRKGPYRDENFFWERKFLLREKISVKRISRIFRLVVTSTIEWFIWFFNLNQTTQEDSQINTTRQIIFQFRKKQCGFKNMKNPRWWVFIEGSNSHFWSGHFKISTNLTSLKGQ